MPSAADWGRRRNGLGELPPAGDRRYVEDQNRRNDVVEEVAVRAGQAEQARPDGLGDEGGDRDLRLRRDLREDRKEEVVRDMA